MAVNAVAALHADGEVLQIGASDADLDDLGERIREDEFEDEVLPFLVVLGVVHGPHVERGDLGLELGEDAPHGGHALGVLREELLQQGRVDRAGAEGVDPDALPRELHAELAGHREHAQ